MLDMIGYKGVIKADSYVLRHGRGTDGYGT
jgi:hypothetical protein